MISKTLLCFPFFSPRTHLRPLCPAGSLRGLEGPGKVKSLEQVETPSTSLCCCFRTGARHTHVLVGRGLWLALAVRVRGLGWLTRWAQSWSGNCQAAKGNSLLGVHRCKLLQASAPGSPGVSLRSSGHEALKTPLPTVQEAEPVTVGEEGDWLISSECPTGCLGTRDTEVWLLFPVTAAQEMATEEQPPERRY